MMSPLIGAWVSELRRDRTPKPPDRQLQPRDVVRENRVDPFAARTTQRSERSERTKHHEPGAVGHGPLEAELLR
jgi:hypothetical protein